MQEIGKALRRGDLERLRAHLDELAVQDIARAMLEVDSADRFVLFRLLPHERAAEVFAYLEPEHQDRLLRELTHEETREIVRRLSPDDRTALLQELPAEVTRRLLDLLSPVELRQARELLGYPPESVGRLMTPRYIAVQPEWTIDQALNHIRANADRGETANVIYVIDAHGKLLDGVELRRFVFADPRWRVRQIMTGKPIRSLSAFDDREMAVRAIQHYDLNAIPVVNSNGVLLGIVTVDDVMDVAEQEATEDFHRMGTVAPFRGSVRAASPLLLYRKRVFWLVMLVFANLLTGIGIAYYQATIEAALTLVFFLPLVIASGGNAGAQAATLMVRALATGEAQLRDWARLLGKELLVSSALGVTVGLVVWAIGLLRGGIELGIVVGLSMALVVVAGSIVGMTLPFLLSRLRLDPATASAPLITSIADIVGVLVYFYVATALLVRS